MTDLPRVTYSNTGEDFSGVHAHLDQVIPEAEARLLGRPRPAIVGGRDRPEGAVLVARSPIDRDIVLGEFPQADAALVDEAVNAAQAAFPAWRDRGWPKRVAILRAGADTIEARKWDIAVACLVEVGKSRLEAVGEVEEAIDLIRHYCDEMERSDGFRQELAGASAAEHCSVVLRPYGVFGVIAPFNFPVALAVGMVSAALVAGNTVVFKPSDAAGLTGRLVVEALVAGGLPDGVLNLVQGGAETGKAIVNHPLVDGLAFTGSNAVGMTMLRHAAAATAMRPVLCEMGGKNPAFVADSADLAVAASGVARSAFGLSGQKCSAASKAYVARAILDDFLHALIETSGKLVVGDPRRQDVFMGPVIDEPAADRLVAAAARGRRRRTRRARRTQAGRRRVRARPLRPADGRRGPAERPPDQSRRAVRAVPQRAAVRRARRGDRRCQPQRLRPHRRHFHPGPGRARPLPRDDRGRRALRQPVERGDDRRLAGLPDLLRLEGVGDHGQGRARQLVRAAVPARAEPHSVRRLVNKLYESPRSALDGLLRDGMTIMSGGFGLVGNPESLIPEIEASGVTGLTVISNNAGADGFGLWHLLKSRQVRKMISSYIGENKLFAEQYLSGALELELNPQGTLAERIRAGGAGIPAFFTRSGVGTVVADGKPHEEFDGERYVRERWLRADLAIVKAWRADAAGNLQFRKTARNFNPLMATAAQVTVAEAEEIVEVGAIDPDCVHTPGIFVHRIVRSTINEKRIEFRTVREREA